MHVCLITWARYPLIDPDTREIARVLAENGYTVELLMRSNAPKYYYEKKQENLVLHRVHSVKNNDLIDAFLFNFRAFILIMKINKHFSLNAIQCTNFGAALSSIFSKFVLKVPLLYNIRAPNIEFYHPFWMPLHLLLIKNSNKIFSISSAYKKFLNIHYKVPLEKIDVITMGADTSLFSPQTNRGYVRKKHHIVPCGKVLIYVGTLAKERKLEIVLTAFEKVKEEIPNVTLILVGDGDGKDDLLRKSRELGLADSVIFTGYVDSRLVPFYVADADVAVSPIPNTLYYLLSSPTKTFEYMAMGKPVVASNILPHNQIINSGVNGILVKYDDPHQYAQAIIDLLTNDRKAEEIGIQARKDALTKYDWRVVLLPMTSYLATLKNKTCQS